MNSNHIILQSFIVRLVSVDGGARIGDISTATVVIQSNDSPYGTVSFDSTVSVVTEGDNDTVAMVPVRRRWAGEILRFGHGSVPRG